MFPPGRVQQNDDPGDTKYLCWKYHQFISCKTLKKVLPLQTLVETGKTLEFVVPHVEEMVAMNSQLNAASVKSHAFVFILWKHMTSNSDYLILSVGVIPKIINVNLA